MSEIKTSNKLLLQVRIRDKLYGIMKLENWDGDNDREEQRKIEGKKAKALLLILQSNNSNQWSLWNFDAKKV
ncbi:hypothetical protein PanWU01x14_233000 [Parasponia andersonii]|uniref:Uncharacterized protein n=1 Tax=Parasponia andersonii TaxID=3476 RepID=A0A2P5BJR6_PARAD|nr:hypothetical protein PanWU01x14_233000 [Parasponia andersonii]